MVLAVLEPAVEPSWITNSASAQMSMPVLGPLTAVSEGQADFL